MSLRILKVNVQKGVLRFREKNLTIDFLVESNSRHPLLSSMTTLSILVRVCIQALGFYKLGFFLSGLWLSYYALVFVYLMQAFNYMLWMKKCSMTFSLENESGIFYVIKAYWIYIFICCRGIYYIKIQTLSLNT